MLLLIDTSSAIGRLAVSNGSNLYSEMQLLNSTNKSDYIINNINNLLSSLSVNTKDISNVAYCNFGSSFTSIRVGLCVAMSMALANNAQLFSLDPACCLAYDYFCKFNKKEPFTDNCYLVVLLPSYQHRVNLVLIKQEHNSLNDLVNTMTTVNRYNIDIDDEVKVELPIDYIAGSAILVLNTINNLDLDKFKQQFFYHQQSVKKKVVFIVGDFQINNIVKLISMGHLTATNPNNADLYYA